LTFRWWIYSREIEFNPCSIRHEQHFLFWPPRHRPGNGKNQPASVQKGAPCFFRMALNRYFSIKNAYPANQFFTASRIISSLKNSYIRHKIHIFCINLKFILIYRPNFKKTLTTMRHCIALVFTTRQQSLPQNNLLKIREMKRRQDNGIVEGLNNKARSSIRHTVSKQ